MTTIEETGGITRRGVTPSRALTWRKTASGHALYLRDRGKALATVEPDGQHAGMWRIHMPDGWISDLANLPRAREARNRLRSLRFKPERNGQKPPARCANGGGATPGPGGRRMTQNIGPIGARCGP